MTAKPLPQRMFVTYDEAAEIAGYSRRQFRRVLEHRKLDCFKIGRRMFVLTAKLEVWMEPKRGEQ